MAAKLRPRVNLPRHVSSTATRTAGARGRQLQRLVGQPCCQDRPECGRGSWEQDDPVGFHVEKLLPAVRERLGMREARVGE
jgi:hypothetical protein